MSARRPPVTSTLAASYNTVDVQRHADWHSLRLAPGEESHARRLRAALAEDSLDARRDPGRERHLGSGAGGCHGRSGRDYTGEAAFITKRGDDGLYVRLTMPDTEALLDSMRHGETLRLRIHRAEEDYWFMVFS